MLLIDQIAEQRIAEARERGEFDDLPGMGRPLQLEDDRLIPEELRAGYRLLKNAGYIPPEAETLREIEQLQASDHAPEDPLDRTRAQRRLHMLYVRLGESRGFGPNSCFLEYRQRLLGVLSEQ